MSQTSAGSCTRCTRSNAFPEMDGPIACSLINEKSNTYIFKFIYWTKKEEIFVSIQNEKNCIYTYRIFSSWSTWNSKISIHQISLIKFIGDFCPIFTFVMCFCPLFDILRKGQFQSCFIPWNGGHRAIQWSSAVRHFLWNFECSTFSASQTEFFSQVCNFSYKSLQSYLAAHWSKWCIQFRRHVILGCSRPAERTS